MLTLVGLSHVIQKVRGNLRRKRAMAEEESLAVIASSSESKIALWEVDTSKKLFRLKASHEAARTPGQTFGSLCWEKNSIPCHVVNANRDGRSMCWRIILYQ